MPPPSAADAASAKAARGGKGKRRMGEDERENEVPDGGYRGAAPETKEATRERKMQKRPALRSVEVCYNGKKPRAGRTMRTAPPTPTTPGPYVRVHPFETPGNENPACGLWAYESPSPEALGDVDAPFDALAETPASLLFPPVEYEGASSDVTLTQSQEEWVNGVLVSQPTQPAINGAAAASLPAVDSYDKSSVFRRSYRQVRNALCVQLDALGKDAHGNWLAQKGQEIGKKTSAALNSVVRTYVGDVPLPRSPDGTCAPPAYLHKVLTCPAFGYDVSLQAVAACYTYEKKANVGYRLDARKLDAALGAPLRELTLPRRARAAE